MSKGAASTKGRLEEAQPSLREQGRPRNATHLGDGRVLVRQLALGVGCRHGAAHDVFPARGKRARRSEARVSQ